MLRLEGTIDESFSPSSTEESASTVVLELSGVIGITSPGVRAWCNYMAGVPSETELYLVGCPRPIIDQLNLVVNFGGRARVLTARLDFICASCGDVEETVDILRDGPSLLSGRAQFRPCPNCGGSLTWDDPNSLRFISRHRATSLDPAAARVLSRLGLYESKTLVPIHQQVDVSKLVEGDVTLLRMSGTVDHLFRWQRVVADLEGSVTLVLDSLTLSPTGIEIWDRFFFELLKRCTHVILVDLPSQMIELDDLGSIDLASGYVYSMLLPLCCSVCGKVSSLRVLASNVVRKGGASGPCQSCGGPATLVEGLVGLERVRKKFRPVPRSVELVASRTADLFNTAAVAQQLLKENPRADGDGERMQIGEYRIIRRLSEGGMAEVFLAARTSLGGFEKPVALKRFRRSLLETSRVTIDMFLREARICANLNHPNIIQTLDVGEHAGDLYLAMEYIDGWDARSILNRHGRALPSALAVLIVSQVAAALDYAHNARDLAGRPLELIHRDISLQNVLVGADGVVKLIDFGIALVGRQTQPRMLAGNFSYMSPEQSRGEKIDSRSDLFSLGVVLHELLAGRHLFRRETIPATISALLVGPIPPVPDVPPSLASAIAKALDRDPDRRFQSGAEMRAVLESAASDLDPVNGRDLATFLQQTFATAPPPGVAHESSSFLSGETMPMTEAARVEPATSEHTTTPEAQSGIDTSVDGETLSELVLATILEEPPASSVLTEAAPVPLARLSAPIPVTVEAKAKSTKRTVDDDARDAAATRRVFLLGAAGGVAASVLVAALTILLRWLLHR